MARMGRPRGLWWWRYADQSTSNAHYPATNGNYLATYGRFSLSNQSARLMQRPPICGWHKLHNRVSRAEYWQQIHLQHRWLVLF